MVIIENIWDIKYIQILLEKIFITKKFTQCKTTRILTVDVFKIQIIKILQNCFQNINCFSWIKVIPVLIHLKYLYYNPSHTETPLQHNTHHIIHWSSFFAYGHPNNQHQKCFNYLSHIANSDWIKRQDSQRILRGLAHF